MVLEQIPLTFKLISVITVVNHNLGRSLIRMFVCPDPPGTDNKKSHQGHSGDNTQKELTRLSTGGTKTTCGVVTEGVLGDGGLV